MSAPFLAIETATSRAIVALGALDGTLLAADAWEAGHRHAEEILARVATLLAHAAIGRPAPGRLAGVVVGTGPGGFTGLRVGLATARGIARAAGAPLVGIPTGASLEGRGASRGGRPARHDRRPSAGGPGRSLPRPRRDGMPRAGRPGRRRPRAGRRSGRGGPPRSGPEDAVARGAAALAGLPAALVALGAARLRAGADDGASLGPEYVTLPRGIAAAAGEVTWSPGPR